MSFRTRLALTMSAVILAISGAIWIYLPRKLEKEAIALISQKAETLAQLTAFTIHPAIYFQDRAALEEALTGARRDRDVAFVIVTDPAGKQLAAFHSERARGARLFEVTAPIREDDRELARLRIGMSLARLDRQLARMRLAIGTLSAAVLAAGLLAVVLISNLMTRPLRDLSKRLLSVQEQERVRISREVHDELGQALTAMKIDLQQIIRAHPELADSLGKIGRNIDEIVDIVRRIAADLRPSVLDDLGVTAALEQQLRRVRESTGLKTTLKVVEEPQLDMLTGVTLYRIAQEGLANVVRHANASEVEMTLSVRDGAAVLEIRDDGRGIRRDEATSPQSLGLLGIRERAELLGGSVTIDGRPGKGTVLTVTLPLSNASTLR
ncbi:MAG TPA: ATP-binding protein [Thermoanaerobaculia bacterium]|nr:ATP-binding protein [Thermoanaerobaculia bacterium]